MGVTAPLVLGAGTHLMDSWEAGAPIPEALLGDWNERSRTVCCYRCAGAVRAWW
jgi:hypothetical protein